MITERLLRQLSKLRDSSRIVSRQVILAVAFLLFIGLFLFSYRSLPGFEVSWAWFVPTAVAIVATIFLSGIEYQLSGRILGHRIIFGEALQISVLSSAANLLPIPGSVILRTESLKRKGSSYAQALSSTAAIGIGWVGTAGIMAGVLVLWRESATLGWVLVVGGAVALLAAIVLLKRHTSAVFSLSVQLVAVEATLVILTAARLFGVLKAIGIAASVTQAVALSLSDALAAAVGIFPSGLGLREAIAGALSLFIDLSPAGAVLAAALDRVIALLILAVAAVLILTVRPAAREQS